jgi:hypothetical protein
MMLIREDCKDVKEAIKNTILAITLAGLATFVTALLGADHKEGGARGVIE